MFRVIFNLVKRSVLKNLCLSFLIIFAVSAIGMKEAYGEFDTDWSNTFDAGLTDMTGDELLAQWLVVNGYYANFSEAQHFALTGYIGYNNADPDPYFWNLTNPFSMQIVEENARFADENLLGTYTGSGSGKILTQVFNGTETGPQTLSVSGPFGLYLATPEHKTWYTDRAENTQQNGTLKRSGGNPQGLIYELKPGEEWLVAWEDKDATRMQTDRDYNDMYVKITSVVPEPISCVLYLLGGGALAARLRRKK